MRSIPIFGMLVAASGCSAVVADSNAEADGTDATVHAAVVIERVESLPSAPPLNSNHVSARFLRISGGLSAETAEQLFGSPALEPDVPLGCTWRDGGSPTVPAVEGSIELLDVGEIVLHALRGAAPPEAPGASVIPLAARAFPDVGGLVSGVVYTSRDGSSELPDDHTYVIETSGSALVDAFSIQVEAPAAPSRLRLGSKLGSEHAFTLLAQTEAVSLASGEPLAIAWDASGTASGDRIYIESALADDDHAPLWRCVFDDVGSGSVPAAYTRFASGTELELVIHRVRRTAVKLPGDAEEAVVDFDFAVAARATVTE